MENCPTVHIINSRVDTWYHNESWLNQCKNRSSHDTSRLDQIGEWSNCDNFFKVESFHIMVGPIWRWSSHDTLMGLSTKWHVTVGPKLVQPWHLLWFKALVDDTSIHYSFLDESSRFFSDEKSRKSILGKFPLAWGNMTCKLYSHQREQLST